MEIVRGSENDLVAKAFERIRTILLAQLEKHSHCNILLSGGKSPIPLYHKMAEEIDFWDQINLFLSDERFVPVLDLSSNQGMIQRELISKTNISEENVFFPPIGENPHISAEEYNFTLKSHFDNWGSFDLALVGIGEDGHTLSLFPHSSALTADTHFYLPVDGEEQRLTGTFELLKKIKNLIVFAPGKNKLEALKRALDEDISIEDCPIRWIVKNVEHSTWFVSGERK